MRKGQKASEESRLKMSLAKKGKPTGRCWNKGLRTPPEVLAKISASLKGKRHPHTEETKRKISTSTKGVRVGSLHPRWIADRTKIKQYWTERNNPEYKQWRIAVWLRDNFKCKIANPDCRGRLEAHHILSWREFPELRYDINNGITLCHAHHPRGRAEEKRLSPYFQGLVTVSKD